MFSFRSACLLFSLLWGPILVLPARADAGRESSLLDDNWKFHLGDFPLPGNTGVPVEQWQWRPAAVAEVAGLNELQGGVQAGDWQKGTPVSPVLPEAAQAGDWKPAALDENVFQKGSNFAWFRATLPPGKDTPSYLYFEDRPSAYLIYFNGKLVTPMIYGRSKSSFSVPLEGWRQNGPNVVMFLMRGSDSRIGRSILVSSDKTGSGGLDPVDSGPAASIFDDAAWPIVSVPHDYVIEAKFDPSAVPGHAYLPVQPAWYRRTLTIPASDHGKQLWLQFDGVYCNAFLWINGKFVGLHFSGYNSYCYDITHLVDYGKSNEIAIRVDPQQAMGWWYEGGGILRHVHLISAGALHVQPWGIQVTPAIQNPGDGRTADSIVTVVTSVENSGTNGATAKVISEIVDASGHTVAQDQASEPVPANEKRDVTQTISLARATLWAPDHPYLYTLRTTIEQDDARVDEVTTTFGVRQIRWDPDNGFILNGIPTKLKGTCDHGDFIGVGTGLPDSIQTWRIQKLKELGSNALRSAHNPPAPEMLEACDRLGMMVIDENRYLGDSPEILGELENMVRRDRNHPSVILWSIANEERAQGAEIGQLQAQAMVAAVRRLDDRKVTAAMNKSWGEPSSLTKALDVQGFNYSPQMYDKFHQMLPQMPVVATEIASTETTRGEYQDDPEKGYVSAYNTKKTPPENAWGPVASRPFVAGGFVWTGFEYKGEPTPYRWPCLNSNFGIMDNCGFPKDDYWYYKSWWSDSPQLHIGGHWNWPGKEGQLIPVQVYSNCDQVELFLNGKSQGVQQMPLYGTLKWSVPYEPGTLEARATKGMTTIRDTMETIGVATALELSSDHVSLPKNGTDVAMITVKVVDDHGRAVPTAANALTFAVEGPGKIIGVGNGDPSSHEPDQANSRLAFNGMAMLLIKTEKQDGTLRVSATSPGLKAGEIVLRK